MIVVGTDIHVTPCFPVVLDALHQVFLHHLFLDIQQTDGVLYSEEDVDVSQKLPVEPAILGIHALDIFEQVHLACTDNALQEHVVDLGGSVHQFHVLVDGIHAVRQGQLLGIDVVILQCLFRNPLYFYAGGFQETGKDAYRKDGAACQIARESQIGFPYFCVVFRFHIE